MSKILIVEDEPAMRKALVDKFERENFEVIEAKNGKEGFNLAIEEQPCLIILDILMPKVDGLTLMKKIRKENEWGKNVPLVILTNLPPDDKAVNQISEDKPTYYLLKCDSKIEDIVMKAKELLGINTDQKCQM